MARLIDKPVLVYDSPKKTVLYHPGTRVPGAHPAPGISMGVPGTVPGDDPGYYYTNTVVHTRLLVLVYHCISGLALAVQ